MSTGVMASSPSKVKIPLAYDWGGKVSPSRGSPHRHQWLTWKHAYPVQSPPSKCSKGRINITQLDESTRNEIKESLGKTPEAGLPPVEPKWAHGDREVLRFFGYFQESVSDSRKEIPRTRRVVILYWPIDGTFQINEVKQPNSGIPAGTLVKRHLIQRSDCSIIELGDIRLGGEVEIYGKRIRVADCDEYTRSKIPADRLGQREDMPVDKYTIDRYNADHPNDQPHFIDHDFKDFLAAQSGVLKSKIDRGAFLSLGGLELRFKCLWGETHLLLRYFMDTEEIMVMELGNFEGKDPFPTIFKRGKLPLDWRSLNTEPGGLPRGTPCYGPDNFRLGNVIDLYGRDVRLMKCDEYTREWYRDRGIDVGQEVKYPDPPPPLPRNTIPPRDAFTIGSDEDTIRSCLAVVPTKPRPDYKKRIANAGMALRFKTKIVTKHPVDSMRRFVLKFHLEDDTISIFEQLVPNLGVVAGKFRQRMLIKKPDRSRFAPDDFKVGETVNIDSYIFELLSADSFTKQWIAAYEAGVPFKPAAAEDFSKRK